MTWNSGEPHIPTSVEEWLDLLQRRLNTIEASPRGAGRNPWNEAVLAPGFEQDGSGTPCWRKLNDGRIELRGRVKKGATVGGTFTAAPLNDGDVIMTMEYEAAPPSNAQHATCVIALAPCTVADGNPGVLRIDIQREPTWRTQPVTDGYGFTHQNTDGSPVMKPASRVQVIARPPKQVPITGWVAFDHVIYDPYLYVDALPPVKYDEEPLVPEPGVGVMQQPDGSVITVTPGVEYSPVLPPPPVPLSPVIFWVPHQDDETLSMGVSMVNAWFEGRGVEVHMMTDGSASGVQPILGLDDATFIAARNNEMVAAVKRLHPTAVVFTDDVVVDGTLTAARVTGKAQAWVAAHPGVSATHVGTHYLDVHSDHQAVANGLKAAGVPYVLLRLRPSGYVPSAVEAVTTFDAGNTAVRAALDEFKYFDPPNLRYGIGYRSVPSYFDWEYSSIMDWKPTAQ